MRIWGVALDHLVVRQDGFQREASKWMPTDANPCEQVGNHLLLKIVACLLFFFSCKPSRGIGCLCFLSTLPTSSKRQRCSAIIIWVSREDGTRGSRDRRHSGKQGEGSTWNPSAVSRCTVLFLETAFLWRAVIQSSNGKGVGVPISRCPTREKPFSHLMDSALSSHTH